MSTQKMKALVWHGPDFAQLKLEEVPIPGLSAGDALVKTVAAALNPVDWKMPLLMKEVKFPLVTGTDFAGFIAKTGENVKDLKVGEGVFGFGLARELGGSFAENKKIIAEMVLKKPDSLSFEQASTLALNMTTAGQAFKELGLPLVTDPKEKLENKFILIWGGSTAVGSFAIQLAKLAGLEVIATSSPHNFEHLKSLGAKHVFDYHSDDVAKKIQEITGNNLLLAIECSGIPNNKCAEALSNKGKAKLAYVVSPPTNVPSSASTLQVYGGKVFLDDENKQWYHKFWQKYLPLFDKGTLVPPQVEILKGLDGIIGGLKRLQGGEISGKKLVAVLSPSTFEAH